MAIQTIENFRVERSSGDTPEYILHVNFNGLSGKYVIRTNGALFLRGGDLYNIDEMPPSRAEFDEVVKGIVACSSFSFGKEDAVLDSFREYTCV